MKDMSALTDAISAVLRDLRYGLPDRGCVEAMPVAADPGYWDIEATFADGTVTGFRIGPDDAPPDDVLVSVADGLQTAFIVHHQKTIPACPGHSHPLEPASRGGRGVWLCPATRETRFAIGQYDPSNRRTA